MSKRAWTKWREYLNRDIKQFKRKTIWNFKQFNCQFKVLAGTLAKESESHKTFERKAHKDLFRYIEQFSSSAAFIMSIDVKNWICRFIYIPIANCDMIWNFIIAIKWLLFFLSLLLIVSYKRVFVCVTSNYIHNILQRMGD